MAKGIFIVLDGLDGSGKSTIAKMLHDYIYSKEGYNALLTSEPTDGKYGREIRKMLAEEKNPKENAGKMLELFVNDRREHLRDTIIPFLKGKNKGKNAVICDRYYYSTIAFQSTQGIDANKIIGKNRDFLKPDIAFIMDITPEIALDRIEHRKKEKFEQLEFMKELRENFLRMKEMIDDNIKIIDASKSNREVFEQIKEEIDKIL
ncbi:MAG: dTMP kinase [Nanoarchaeota archaeon]